jgi:multicomponent Na+:H+ antiporter subunit B
MNSFMLRQVARGVLPITVLFALYLLLRGHNNPGGGFVAGLVTSAAVVLGSLANGWPLSPRHSPRVQSAIWAGLCVTMAAGLVATFAGDPFLRAYHTEVEISKVATYSVSTVLLFDIGVYLVVVGSTVTALNAFAQEDE